MTIGKSVWALVLAGVLAATPAFAEVQLRLSTAAPGNAPLTEVAERVAKNFNAAYPGEVNMTVHHSSTLFKQGTEMPALQRGNLEMSTPVTFEIEQQLPEYGALGAAYLFRDVDHMIKVYNGEIGQQFRDDVQDKMGVVILGTAYLGTRTVNLKSARDVAGPTDLSGVKMRMPPGPAFQTLAEALGATPVSMPITEVYLALRTGSIDAQDNPTNMTRDWKFYEVTEQVILTRHLVQPVFIAISKTAWDKLSEEQQGKLRGFVEEAVAAQIELTKTDEAEAIAQFKEAGMTITEVDTELFRKAVWAKYEEKGLTETWKDGLAEAVQAVE